MAHVYQYLVFLAEAVTVVVAVLVVLSAIASLSMRHRSSESGHLEVRKLNDRLEALRNCLQEVVLDPASFKKVRKQEAKTKKQEGKAVAKSRKTESETEQKRRVFVIDFEGDVHASKVDHLRTEITAMLTLAQPTDEAVVRIESPGGEVHGYGLAASQLARIKEHGIPLVVTVDKIAASGGYLMAAVADRVLAAPFAIVGSIGVIAQIPNVHRLLKKHDVDVEVLSAGRYKRTLTLLGENTEEGRKKFVEELEDIHALFQEFVSANRPALDISRVATGEAWYGQRAIDLQLVDEISTSDEYLSKACDDADVFEIRWVENKKPFDRVMARMETGIKDIFHRVMNWRGGI
ncbi:MAG: protease SohB [Gammaproteobacteria bacterium]|nr:protease SohB [Gammaproteobacteria bacterium]